MLVVEIFAAALDLAHPKLNGAHGISGFSQLRTESRNDLVSIGTLVHQEFDDHLLSILHLNEFQIATPVM
jgi:hypothetical protein